MLFFIDSANVDEIKSAADRGWVDGVTTNPSLVAKTGRPMKQVIKDICKVTPGPVSAEVIGLKAEEMISEGEELALLADNVVVKIPMSEQGLIATKKLYEKGIKTNVTLVFSPLQALMVAKAGATLVSPFVGRLDDIANNGMSLISQMKTIFANYSFATKILVASIRHPVHVLEAATIGADIVTVPYKVMQQLVNHPLTDKGIKQFLDDWNKAQQ